MDSLKKLGETDEFLFAQEKDDLRAMAIITMLGACTRLYGEEPLFLFFDRMRCAVETKQYGILYQRESADANVVVPVAVMTWAFLSPPNAAMFQSRLRPLARHEWKSGKQLWVMDNIAPYASGHFDEVRSFMEELHSECAVFLYTKLDGKEWVKKTMPNRKHEKGAV